MFDRVWEIVLRIWEITALMAPYLLFGFLMAGMISVLISPAWIERHLGGRGWRQIVKSVFFGIPLPLCSCSVLPVTVSLQRHGASRAASVGFLLATPQTGIDSLLATWGALGPVFGIFRPVAALFSGLLGGFLTLWFGAEDHNVAKLDGSEDFGGGCQESCCAETSSGRSRLRRALEYAFVTLPGDIAGPLLLGLVLAGLMAALVPAGLLRGYLDGGLGAMLIMLLMGVPVYVCATASIPVAVGFMYLGASPGAALVFLASGPATNAASLTVIWRIFGRRTALIYLLTVILGALVSGLLLDLVYSRWGGDRIFNTGFSPERISWVGNCSAAVLLLLLLFALLCRFWSRGKSSGPA